MEETINSSMLAFDSPKEQSSYIKVIGVGGGGGNAVNNMYMQGIKGADFIICNTDQKALNNSPVSNKIVLGHLGAGNNPEVARIAALEHKEEIRCALENNTQMLFITAGMGGGTGTGAAPVIAEIAKEIETNDPVAPKILVVAVVTKPFGFEGRRRRDQALEGIEKLRKHVDAIVIINNDKLRELGNLTLNQAFKEADNVLFTAVKGITEIITVTNHVGVDFHDINTVMSGSGTALMGIGVGKGDNRAMEAIQQATTSVLLDDSNIEGAKDVLLYFTYAPNKEITMDEMSEVTEYLTNLTGHDCSDVIWGAGTDDTLNDELKVTLIATGFPAEKQDGGKKEAPNYIDLNAPEKKEEKTIYSTQTETTNQVSHEVKEHDEESGIKVVHIEKPVTAEAVAPAPTAVAQPVTPQPTVKRILYLDDEPVQETAAENATTAQPQDSNDGIQLIQHTPTAPMAEVTAPVMEQVVAEPAVAIAQPTPAPTPSDISNSHSPFGLPFAARNNGVLSTAERLQRAKRLNEMLHNDPNGPQKVASMTTAQLTNESIYMAPHSSESDANRMTLSADGTFKRGNSFLYNNPD